MGILRRTPRTGYIALLVMSQCQKAVHIVIVLPQVILMYGHAVQLVTHVMAQHIKMAITLSVSPMIQEAVGGKAGAINSVLVGQVHHKIPEVNSGQPAAVARLNCLSTPNPTAKAIPVILTSPVKKIHPPRQTLRRVHSPTSGAATFTMSRKLESSYYLTTASISIMVRWGRNGRTTTT